MTSPLQIQQTQQTPWIKELINRNSEPQGEKQDRTPIGFNFQRDAFDPSSYYRQTGSFRDISRNATNVVLQQVANKQEADYLREQQQRQKELESALKGINPKFIPGQLDLDYELPAGTSRKYGLKNVTSNTAKAADYWGSKYGIKDVGGYREHGSVPGSDHPKGRALDFMTYDNKAQGTALANDLIKNYKAWNIKYVIYNRFIWSPDRGWRKYSGPSPHTDHVHASFNS